MTAKSGAALRTFFNLANRWQLTSAEQMALLGISSTTMLQSWKAGDVQELASDTLERLSYMLGIFRAINAIFPEGERADAWMRAANTTPLFGGGTALERMCRGTVADLHAVYRYLNAELHA